MKQYELSGTESLAFSCIIFGQIQSNLIAIWILHLLKVSAFIHGMLIQSGCFSFQYEKKVLQYTVFLIYRLIISPLLALAVFLG